MPPPPASDPGIDARSGYCAATGTFHSLRTTAEPLPPPLSFPAFAFSLLPSTLPPSPSRPALVDAATGESVTLRAFLSRVSALAAALRARLRLNPGDVAFVLAPAGVHVPVLYYALMSVGAVASPANPALTAAEVSRLLALSSPRVAFAVAGTSGKLPPGLRTVLLDSPTFLSFLHEDGEGAAAAAADVVVRQSDPAAVLYSSGTTGRAKAVVLTHRNLMASGATRAPAAGETLLLTVPLFHIYGFSFCLRAASAADTLVLHTARGRFDAAAVLATVARFGVTRLALAPPALLAIVRAAEEDAAATARAAATLKAVTCGGAPAAADLIARFSRKFPGVSLAQGYGLTETTAGFCRTVGEEESARVGTVGRLSWGAQVKIVHPETGAALPPGVPGELWVRGPFVMKGYLGEKDSTSEVLDSEGWFRTGDVCYIDQDGFVYIVDRLKELIKYKGYQVAPAELESLLQTHPDIDEAAVVPYPDEEAGELPVAFIVKRPGSHLHESHIKEFIAKQGYGLTETTSGFCRAVGEDESARIGSVGRLLWGAQVRIVHPETGAALPPGVPGELWVRGPFVMQGYLGDRDSTSEVLDSEGWLRTGDLCYIDQDGFVYIVDRLKEIIKYKGYQVPPVELENLLQTHPDIDEAAVVPYLDEEAGELPVAFIVRRPGSHLHESHIKEFVANQVVHYKRIHHVFVVDSIPRNAAGKILRKDLAKLALRRISSKL